MNKGRFAQKQKNSNNSKTKLLKRNKRLATKRRPSSDTLKSLHRSSDISDRKQDIEADTSNIDHKNRAKKSISKKPKTPLVPFKPFATALDEEGHRYLLIALPHEQPLLVSVGDIPGGIRELMKRGAALASSHTAAAFRRSCDEVIGRDPTARVLTRPGFSRGLDAFVHGARAIQSQGDKRARVLLDPRLPAATRALSHSSGSLEGWLALAKGARQNRLFSFLLSLAFGVSIFKGQSGRDQL